MILVATDIFPAFISINDVETHANTTFHALLQW